VSPEAETGTWFFCLRHPAEAGCVRLVMVGELDLVTAGRARDAIRRAQDDAAEVICDLGDLTFIDVWGLHVLLDAGAHARHTGARLILAHTPASMSRALEGLGLEHELEMDSRSPTLPHLWPADCTPEGRRVVARRGRARHRR
ncbi:MAG: STAS domain-containing protein, partial [Thermoleophilia bacterium]